MSSSRSRQSLWISEVQHPAINELRQHDEVEGVVAACKQTNIDRSTAG